MSYQPPLALYVPVSSEECKLRVFCFYGSGQTGANLRHLTFPKGVERCIVERPGHGSRALEDLCEDLCLLTSDTVECLEPLLNPSCTSYRPYAIFAYSLGVTYAYEFARTTRRLFSSVPLALYISVRRAPGMPVGALCLPNGKTFSRQDVVKMSDTEFLTVVAEYYGMNSLKTLLQSAEEGNVQLKEYLFSKVAPMVRNDMDIGASAAELFWDPEYHDEPPLPCDLITFAAGHATDVDSGAEAMLGWKEVVDGNFEVHTINATHDSILCNESMLSMVNQHLTGLLSKLCSN